MRKPNRVVDRTMRCWHRVTVGIMLMVRRIPVAVRVARGCVSVLHSVFGEARIIDDRGTGQQTASDEDNQARHHSTIVREAEAVVKHLPSL
ncbi:MAG: hypothetical protein IPK83_14120 [Planctomycetes bacterium]|nr:hypothetical protein [Planctomycetota bacterium]